MIKKLNIEFIKSSFLKEGYVLPEDWKYVNSHTKIPYVCSKGHKSSISWNSWKSGSRCKYCIHNMPSSEDVRAEFAKEGHVISEDWKYVEYVDSMTKIPYVCSKGHKNITRWFTWKGGHRCKYCSQNGPSSEDVRASFLREGCVISEDWSYANNCSKIPYVCSNGHEHSISWNSWSKGHHCKHCNLIISNIRKTNSMRLSFTREGYILSKDWKYVNAHTTIPYVCSNGHHSSILWGSWKGGHRCKYCNYMKLI